MDTYRLLYGAIFGLLFLDIASSKTPLKNDKCYNPESLKYLTRTNDGNCGTLTSISDFDVLGWKDTSQRWKITNFDNKVEISLLDGHLTTIIRHQGHLHHLKVEKILITRKGTQHLLPGWRRKTAEIQLYHKEHDKFGRQAFSIFVRQRNGKDNSYWQHLLRPLRNLHRRKSLQTRPTVKLKSTNFNNFIFEDNSNNDDPLRIYGKYQESENSSCDAYTWRLFKHHVHLTRRQFRILAGGHVPHSTALQSGDQTEVRYCEDQSK